MHQQKLWKINLYKKDMLEEIKESAEIFVCDCNSREHQIVFQYDFDDNYVYCHIHLSQYSFGKGLRLLNIF
jgi:hypothetical protein